MTGVIENSWVVKVDWSSKESSLISFEGHSVWGYVDFKVFVMSKR